eukprot:CAMPEP_0171256070 /NCGR_PEP_ID=MMETSP0790-20130122/53103_1 /TAXON_ID=2925 /ORGANISM="Alexandrium catenella, Strain OF101" /LENGTH=77 /DNA_ID=CAMNT_0011724063 /DNA_START=40 /DNA_END=270 /DNA_ORIENTATION=-
MTPGWGQTSDALSNRLGGPTIIERATPSNEALYNKNFGERAAEEASARSVAATWKRSGIRLPGSGAALPGKPHRIPP